VLRSCLSFLQSLDFLDSSHYTGVLAATSTYLCVHNHLSQEESKSPSTCPNPTPIMEDSAREKIKELLSQASKMEDESTETLAKVKKSLEEVLSTS